MITSREITKVETIVIRSRISGSKQTVRRSERFEPLAGYEAVVGASPLVLLIMV